MRVAIRNVREHPTCLHVDARMGARPSELILSRPPGRPIPDLSDQDSSRVRKVDLKSEQKDLDEPA